MNLYHNANHDTSKIKLLSTISEGMMSNKWSHYLNFQYEMILDVSTRSGKFKEWSKIHLARALTNLGYLSAFEHGDTKKGLTYLFESIKIQKEIEDQKGLAVSYSNLGSIYNINGKIKEAHKYHFKSFKIREQLSDLRGMAYCYNNIGSVYYIIGNDNLALKYYKKAQKIRERQNDQRGIGNSYARIAKIHYKKGELKIALKLFNRALEIHKTLGYKIGVSSTLNSIGKVYISLQEIEMATSYFKKNLALSEEINYKHGIAGSFYGLAEINFKKGRIEKSRQFAEKAHVMFKELKNIKEVVSSSKLLSEIYEQQAKTPEAYNFYKLHISLKDSLNKEENQRAAIGQEYKYEYEKKALSNKIEHEKQRDLEKLHIERERYGLFGISLILIIVLGGFLRIRYLKSLRERKQLLNEIELSKQKGISRVITGMESPAVLVLNKEKIEASINVKLNVSDWNILNTIFNNPLISNKEIANQVALSLEGTSSSLRKMYRLFDLKDAKNKKLALTIEATRISSELI